ncbi:SUMF1/EgtB/PvdO family nonheme iron enzyme [Piscinibacter sakaiensis]|uniref:Serine/threonine kinase n=1 Tax=Piscinibacter sakaiensis TaxID=1547922 RepID=A0A0K8P0C9_PISS1|nr:SUMF1/EgtB/PvdO family nonheme iron enzyme [Piscinibacter sakaiensis]GAP36088.1 serine/threonine kinase [Piscinibacter sakaiensis]
MQDVISSQLIHTPQVRRAGADWLSLALMDARNHTLRWAAEFERAEQAAGDGGAAWAGLAAGEPEVDAPRWLFGHVGWFQEAWIARNVQRRRGTRCDPAVARLSSIEAEADARFDPTQVPPARRGRLRLPDWQALRQYLADTIEVTLELLSGAEHDDDALYFYRLALLHEDACGEAFAVAAQALGVGPAGTVAGGPWPQWQGLAERAPLAFPATRWTLGSPDGGFLFDNERGPHELRVPAFEIDAAPVTWGQFAEFVEDGGYDEAGCWSAEGWAWLQRDGRRTPRHVQQMRQGVLLRRFGRDTRVPLTQTAVHVNAHEAEAWCRWAGRRLPGEAEWELAAHQGASRGFRWGEAWEWTATTFRPYPGFEPHPWRAGSEPRFHTHRAMRGASPATRGRLRDPKLRRARLPHDDSGFFGFRSCAA